MESHSGSSLDQNRCDDSPSKHGTAHFDVVSDCNHFVRASKPTETPAGVQTAEHTSAKESWCELDDPVVVLKGDRAGEANAVERPANVPIIDLDIALSRLGSNRKLQHLQYR